MEYWYNTERFDDVKDYIKKHNDIEGVDKLSNLVEQTLNDYVEEIEELYDETHENVESLESAWNEVNSKAKKYKKRTIISLIIYIVLSTVIGYLSHGYRLVRIIDFGVELLGLFFFVVFCLFIINKIKSKRAFRRYENCKFNIDNKMTLINNRYRNEADELYDIMDDMYLQSLDPAHREAILMRRDQDRYYQQMIKEQREHQKRMEDEQAKILKTKQKLEEEQAETLKTQKRLLEIEEERERDRLRAMKKI